MDASELNYPEPERRSAFSKKSETDLSGIVDSEVLIRSTFQADREKGYELLFKRYYQPLCSHAARFVYSKEVAEDLVMEVFSQFWQKNLHEGIQTSYRAYLFTSVRHAAYAYLRSEFGREKTWESSLDPYIVNSPNTPQQLLQFHELYGKIEEIIRSTSPQSQKVFVMSRFEGKTNPKIAEELHLSTKTVEGHITKVLSLLRNSLRNYGLLSCFFLGKALAGNVWLTSLSHS
jgi:RNA polymerase sigma-70 factor (family 1)